MFDLLLTKLAFSSACSIENELIEPGAVVGGAACLFGVLYYCFGESAASVFLADFLADFFADRWLRAERGVRCDFYEPPLDAAAITP